MTIRGKHILVLYYHPKDAMCLAVQRHLKALERSPRRHKILYYNAVFGVPGWLKRVSFNAIILHNTFLCLRGNERFHLWKWKSRWLNDLDCLKIAIPQDEYNHSEILDEWLYEIGVQAIFTTSGSDNRKVLYPLMSGVATFYECLSGYIDDGDAVWASTRVQPIESRPYSLVYEAVHSPYSFGNQGRLRHEIANAVGSRATLRGLRCNVLTRSEDAIIGHRWLEFLGSGKVVIGCESGSSVLDRRGEIQAQIRRICEGDPSMSFEKLNDVMPQGWDDNRFTRLGLWHLGAVITKTCQVLMEGNYNGVLLPSQHFIVLRRDYSNLDDVLEQIRDHQILQAMTERAYEDVYRSGKWTYDRFAASIDRAMDELGSDVRDRYRFSETITIAAGWELLQKVAWVSERLPGYARRLGESAKKFWHNTLLFRHPVISLRKAGLGLKLVMRNPLGRRLCVCYLTHVGLRRRTNMRMLLRDLFMFEVLRMVRTGTIPGMSPVRLTAVYNEDQRTLFFLSSPSADDEGIQETVGRIASLQCFGSTTPVRRIVWNHSSVGLNIHYPLNSVRKVNLFLGSNGIYEFGALAASADCLPKDSWNNTLFVDFQVSIAPDVSHRS